MLISQQQKNTDTLSIFLQSYVCQIDCEQMNALITLEMY